VGYVLSLFLSLRDILWDQIYKIMAMKEYMVYRTLADSMQNFGFTMRLSEETTTQSKLQARMSRFIRLALHDPRRLDACSISLGPPCITSSTLRMA